MSILELRGCSRVVTSLLMDIRVVSRRRMISRSSARHKNLKILVVFMYARDMDVEIEDPVNAHAASYPVMEGKGRYTQSTDFEKRRTASNAILPSSIDQRTI
jgi:hypothetical protein